MVKLTADASGGIIPARAGFTREDWRPVGQQADHPRSRGVYISVVTDPNALTGSSPLARGLRDAEPSKRNLIRIIPARAGFTTWPFRAGPRRPDHPRSRGVYVQHGLQQAAARGSSPLARGLRHCAAVAFVVSGIIPARAGFTLASFLGSVRWPDHPRSRGVYWWSRAAQKLSSGSSPLARGLPAADSTAIDNIGIIPARAGFTWSCWRSSSSAPDHPRSRGVYPPGDDSSIASYGSSPLARGLRERLGTTHGRTGIIPARAGFTATMRSSARC